MTGAFKRTALLLPVLFLFFVSSASPETITRKLAKERGLKALPVNILARLPIPEGYHEGIYLDGKDVWVSNGNAGDTWIVEASSGKISGSIRSMAGFTEAVTKGPDGKFYVTDWDEKKLYRVAPGPGGFKGHPVLSFGNAHPAGVIWNGANFFVLTWTRGVWGTKFHLLKLDAGLNTLTRVIINSIQEPCQLAWDGANLWMSSWYDGRVYRVDADRWRITGFFTSPVPKTTGIAFDGKSMWLTGTSSDLYRLEITEDGAMKIKVTSGAFENEGVIPERYTGDGEDISPSISWSDLPAGARSVAVISDDPDAPSGTWVHWVIFNIPPDTKGLAEGVPTDPVLKNGAVQGINDSRGIGYSGPYPPTGYHRYYFKVYALDTMLKLKAGITKKDLLKAMEGHVLAEGQLMGKYKRK